MGWKNSTQSGGCEILDLEKLSDHLKLCPPGRECHQERWDPVSPRSRWGPTNPTWSLSGDEGWKTFAGSPENFFRSTFWNWSWFDLTCSWHIFLNLSETWLSTMTTSMWWKCDCGPPLPRSLYVFSHRNSNLNLTRAWAKRHMRAPASSVSPPMSLTCQQVSFELMSQAMTCNCLQVAMSHDLMSSTMAFTSWRRFCVEK